MGEALGAVEEDHMARRMAGAVQHLEDMRAEGDGLAFLEIAIRHQIAHGAHHVEACRRGFDIGEQHRIVLVRADHRDPQRLAQLVGAAGMVDMAVGNPDLLQRDAVFADDLQDHLDVTAGVDDDALLAVHIEENRAVLLEGGDGDDPGLQHAHDDRFLC